jgi:hypothetical protein
MVSVAISLFKFDNKRKTKIIQRRNVNDNNTQGSGMMNNYIEESAKYRMGVWYNKKFKLNEFVWDKSDEKKYVFYNGNTRYLDWIERWKKLGVKKNPGIILDSQDCLVYDEAINEYQKYFNEYLKQIPYASHNRKANDNNSIIFPLHKQSFLKISSNKCNDSYNFLEKKNDVIWRGKFTGVDRNGHAFEYGSDIENNINDYVRFTCVQMWHKKFNIKFVEDYSNLNIDPEQYTRALSREVVQKNLKYVNAMFAKNKGMIGEYLNFDKEFCKYKYILNLDGHDSSSGITHTLQTNSVMLSPIPTSHIFVNFKLEPWVHYVPLKDDTSDLEEKLKWCNSNQEKCEEVVKNASEYISQFNEKSEQNIEKRIFEKLYENGKT